MGLDNRPAIYIPFAQAVPKLAVIDRDACIHFKTGKCGLCVRTCGAGAINYDQKEEFITKEYGAIVVATGYNQIKPVKFDEYLYSQSKDVVTSLEFERIMNAAGPTKGQLVCPSDGRHPKKIVFVQCVGSRGDSCRDKSYCCLLYTSDAADEL